VPNELFLHFSGIFYVIGEHPLLFNDHSLSERGQQDSPICGIHTDTTLKKIYRIM